MKCLSVKECASTLQIIIAMLCLLTVMLFSFVIPFPEDLKIFMFQCSMATTMMLCLIFGCSIWFYNSNYHKTRFHVRVFIVVVLWITFALDVATAILCDLQFVGKLLYDSFEPEFFDKLDFMLLYLAILLGIIVIVLLFIVNIILTVGVCRRARKGKRVGK
ncbi:uncharacterized protein LOC105665056 [Ceratitis capitata]|uniref:uncharacterized protein LOC105665056 n=1 Tax=Ceratitis capitata TaxID=7213 RepID=UPI000618887D|nr:uncharacterized protein LOC105665056 [Ceratitis capitata]